MGQDGNTIEIEIDAAATQAAAKTAGEANAKLEEFNNALKLFRDNVGTISKTTDSVATKIGDFNTLLQTFSDKLTENLANMQTSVVAKVEPHLERELENLVNRVTNKVEAKYQPEKESRSRSEAKAGAGAVSTGTPGGKRVSVASPPGERPDALLKEQLVKSNERIVDKMGNVVGGALKTTSKTQTSRFEFGQETNAAGELVDIRREIVDEVKTITKTNFVDPYGKDTTLRGQDGKTAELFSMLGPEGLAKVENAPEVRLKDTFYGSISDALDKSLEKGFSGIEQYVPEMMRAAEKNIWKPHEKQLKQNEKTVQAATVAEKDRGLAIRKEITGALIGLHVMKVVSQYSAVFNAGFMQIAAAMGHLLNNLLLPMMPAFTQIAQFLHMLANVLAMLPMPVRQLIGALLMWKGISMLVASMPLKDIKDGFAGIREVMQGADSGIKKFWALLRAFVDFMNSGQGRGAVGSLVAGGKAVGGRIKGLLGRASGGPVLGHGAYIVGEKGPEIFVPKTSGTIVPNHKIGRAEGGDVTAAPFGGDIMGSLGTGLGVGGLAYMLTGSPLLAAGLGAGAGMLGPAGIASMIGSAVSSDIGSNMIASLNVMTGMISSILAPLAPIMGVVGALLGVVTGARTAGGGGGGDRTAETVARFGNEQLKTTGKMSYGIQNATAMSGRGINKILSMILIRLGNCLYVAPCKPDSFATGTTTTTTTLITAITALPAAISVAITAALAALAGTITYTILTNGQVPVVTPVATTITYDIVTKGTIPTATDVRANIVYDIVRNGTEPVVTDKTATITYDIVKNGVEPAVSDITADITYNIRTVGALPQVDGITYDITGKITAIDFTKLAPDLAKVDVIGTIKDIKVAETLPIERRVIDTEGRFVDAKPSEALRRSPPEIPAKGKLVPEIDVRGVEPPRVEVVPEVRSGFDWRSVFERFKLPEIPIEIKPGEIVRAVWEKAGRTAGGFGIAGLVAFLTEWAIRGEMPAIGDFMTRFVVGSIAVMSAPKIVGAIVGYFKGAAVGQAVAGGLSAALEAGFALAAEGLAVVFLADLMDTLSEGFASGDWANLTFNTAPLQAAFDFGQSAAGHGGPMAWTLNPGSEWNTFINNLRSTLAGGVPVDVKIDVDSVTSVVETIAAAAAQNVSGNTAAPPPNMEQNVPPPFETGDGQNGTTPGSGITGPSDAENTTVETQLGGEACYDDFGNVIPCRARGGPVSGGSRYLVGERGPEMFVPDRTGASGVGVNATTPVTVNQTFHVTTNNPKELTDTVMKQLKLELARVKM